MKKALVTIIFFLGTVLIAGRLQSSLIAHHWGVDFAGYCVDERLGDSGKGTSETVSSAQRYAGLVKELRDRLVRVTSVTPAQWQACATRQRDAYINSMLWTRLGLRDARDMPPPIDRLQVERAVARIVNPLVDLVERESAFIATSPADDVLDTRLRSRRGLLATLTELNTKARQASSAAQTMGQTVTVIATGTLVMLLLLLATKRRVWPLLVLLIAWLAAALMMNAISLGAPPLRTVAMRHLATTMGMWSPMVAMLFGWLAFHVAGRDRWLAPVLLDYDSRQGLLPRAGLLLLVGLSIHLGVASVAQRSELYLGLAMLAMAVVAARNALAIGALQATSTFGLPLVLIAALLVCLFARYKQDNGTVVLTVAITAGWLVYLGKLRWALAISLIGGLVLIWWWAQLQTAGFTPMPGETTAVFAQRIAAPCEGLHPRLQAACGLQASYASDVYRSLALARSGLEVGWTGHGLSSLPVAGLAADRLADRTLLQLPMDYSAAAAVAAYGWPGLLGIAVVIGTLLALAARTLGMLAIADQRTDAQHVLASFAAIGLLAAAMRMLISTAGALGALPLTGQPMPMLAYGTTASLALGVYLGIVFAAQPRRGTFPSP